MICNTNSEEMIESNCDLYLNESSSDVLLVIGKDLIPAHKSVLMKNSDYFNAMFSIQMLENGLERVTIEEMMSEPFLFVLRMAYGFKLSPKELTVLSFNDMFDAIIVGNKYHFTNIEHILTDLFFEKLNTNFSPDYLCVNEKKSLGHLDKVFTLNEVQEISKSYNLEYFSDSCKSYIEKKSHRGVNTYKYCYNLWC